MKRSSRAGKPFLALCLIIIMPLFWSPVAWGGSRGPVIPLSGKVALVFDGDTIMLDSGARIRYLGVDAPEVAHEGNPSECWAREAAEFNAGLVLKKQVSLKYDSEKTDVHGRLLAYVFLPDGRCVNAEMLRGGYAYFYRTAEGFSKLDEFLTLQREAIQAGRGMWSRCTPKPSPFYWGNRRSFVLHRPECLLVRAASAKRLVRFQTRRAGFEEGYRPCRYCNP